MKNKINAHLIKSKVRRTNLAKIVSYLEEEHAFDKKNALQIDTLVHTVKALVETGILTPTKNHHAMARYRMLPDCYHVNVNSFTVLPTPTDKDDLRKQLYSLNQELDISYYLKNPTQFQEDHDIVLRVSAFMDVVDEEEWSYVNERSYQLFFDEKALEQPQKASINGELILTRLGLGYTDIKARRTYEPFVYVMRNPKRFASQETRTILIIENKDTFWTFRDALEANILIDVDMVVYGEGNAITRRFEFMQLLGCQESDRYLYFGDLDQEGADIFLRLQENFPAYGVELAIDYYELMLEKGKRIPSVARGTGRNLKRINWNPFIHSFQSEFHTSIEGIIVRQERHIPQEAVTLTVLKGRVR